MTLLSPGYKIIM